MYCVSGCGPQFVPCMCEVRRASGRESDICWGLNARFFSLPQPDDTGNRSLSSYQVRADAKLVGSSGAELHVRKD